MWRQRTRLHRVSETSGVARRILGIDLLFNRAELTSSRRGIRVDASIRLLTAACAATYIRAPQDESAVSPRTEKLSYGWHRSALGENFDLVKGLISILSISTRYDLYESTSYKFIATELTALSNANVFVSQNETRATYTTFVPRGSYVFTIITNANANIGARVFLAIEMIDATRRSTFLPAVWRLVR